VKVSVEKQLLAEVPLFYLKRGGSFLLRLIALDMVPVKGDLNIHPVYQPLFTILRHVNGAVIQFPTPEKTYFIALQRRRPFVQVLAEDTVWTEE
jgi:hypothetical protein